MRGMLVFWIFVLAASCIAEFQAVSQYSQISICQNSTFTDNISVSNFDDEPHSYTLSSDYSKLNPAQFTLAAQYAQRVANSIPAPSQAGEYEIFTRITEDTGKTQVLRQALEVVDCSTIVSIDKNSFSNCQCTPTLYLFNVYNNQGAAKEYRFSVNAPEYTISAESAIIAADSMFPVYVYLNQPCDVLGQQEYMFTATAYNGRFDAPFYLHVRDCYSYGLHIGKSDFCRDGTYSVPLTLNNTGEFQNNYTIYVQSELFTLNETVTIKPGDAWYAGLETNASTGMYDVKVDVMPGLGKDFSREFDLEIKNCLGARVLLTIGAIILLIILLLAIVIMFRKKQSSDKKEIPRQVPAKKEVAPAKDKQIPKKEEKKKAEKAADKEPVKSGWLWWLLGIIAIILLALAVWQWRVQFWSSLQTVWAFFLLYIIYFAAGIIAALIIILFYWRVKYRAGIFFWLVVLLGVCFLLLSLCFFSGVCKVTESAQPMLADGASFVFKKDTVKVIDLSDFINNPDNDPLNISYTPAANLSFQIDSDYRVHITPDSGWSGERVINFILDDGRGGRAVSPDISIIVLDEPSYWYDPITGFLSKYFNYLFAGLLISVIIVILLVLRTQVPRRRLIVKKRK